MRQVKQVQFDGRESVHVVSIEYLVHLSHPPFRNYPARTRQSEQCPGGRQLLEPRSSTLDRIQAEIGLSSHFLGFQAPKDDWLTVALLIESDVDAHFVSDRRNPDQRGADPVN